jgi:outer membrane protein OmpA-like peptidoglycan-associated protein
MKHGKILLTILLFVPFLLPSQTALRNAANVGNVRIEGTVVDKTSGAPLNQTRVTAFDDMLKVELDVTYTDQNGFFSINVPKLVRYSVKAEKATFYDTEEVFFEKNGHIKAGLLLGRKPGYVFDITIFDKAFEHNTINTLRDCKVEIYNNTTAEQVLTVEKLPKSTFNFSFAEGNHYTVLVRKQGYLNRRIEVYVNVNGCILCVDGMGVKEPDLVPIMSHNNEIGHFLGTIDLDSIQIGKRFQLNNIYYDFNKWNIRPEAAKTLDKVAIFLKDNPGIKVELGSHTDARGSDRYNLTLSDKRAKAAVDYILAQHGVDAETITSKGYGETLLANRCDDGFVCSEDEHQLNRRTEIKITGFVDKDPLWERSLKEIIEDKELYKKIIEQEKKQKANSKKSVTK